MQRKVLFKKSSGCQPCEQIKKWLDENGVDYEAKDIMSNLTLAGELNVKSVPTLVVLNEDHKEVNRYVGFKIEELRKGLLNG